MYCTYNMLQNGEKYTHTYLVYKGNTSFGVFPIREMYLLDSSRRS